VSNWNQYDSYQDPTQLLHENFAARKFRGFTVEFKNCEIKMNKKSFFLQKTKLK